MFLKAYTAVLPFRPGEPDCRNHTLNQYAILPPMNLKSRFIVHQLVGEEMMWTGEIWP